MFHSTRLMAFAFVAATLCGVSNAAVLFTTQEDFTGWTGGNAGVASAAGGTDLATTNGIGNTTNPGSSGTAGALTITIAGGYNATVGPGEQGNAAFLAAIETAMNTDDAILLLDYTPPAVIGVYWQPQVHFNYDGTWTGIGPVSTTNHGSYFTAAYNISALSMPGTLSYFQFGVISNNDSGATLGQTFTIDNIRVVPEPASLSLAAAGASLMLRRRRA